MIKQFEYTELIIPNEYLAKTLTQYGMGSWFVSVMLWRDHSHSSFLLQREIKS